MKKTPIYIRAVPPRLAHVEAKVLPAVPDAVVMLDPDFSNRALDGRAKATANFRRALRLAGTAAALHLEDDVELCAGFRALVEAEIARRPSTVIQFFSMRADDRTRGSRWDRQFSSNLCFYLPAGYGLKIEAFVPLWIHDNPQHPGGYDLAVSAWLRSRGERYWIHCPSLVRHAPGKSVIDPRRSTRRQSATFADAAS